MFLALHLALFAPFSSALISCENSNVRNALLDLLGVYDAILEQAMTCACVQEGCPTAVKNGCELLSLVQLLIQLAGGILALLLGFFALMGEWGTGNQYMACDVCFASASPGLARALRKRMPAGAQLLTHPRELLATAPRRVASFSQEGWRTSVSRARSRTSSCTTS